MLSIINALQIQENTDKSKGMGKVIQMKIRRSGVAIFVSGKIDFKDLDKEGHTYQGVNPRRRFNNCKYICRQHRSTSVHKGNDNSHKKKKSTITQKQ